MDGNGPWQGGQKALATVNNPPATRSSTDGVGVSLEGSCRSFIYGLYTKTAADFKDSMCQRSTHICVNIMASLPSADGVPTLSGMAEN